jgi:hypothetical protein
LRLLVGGTQDTGVQGLVLVLQAAHLDLAQDGATDVQAQADELEVGLGDAVDDFPQGQPGGGTGVDLLQPGQSGMATATLALGLFHPLGHRFRIGVGVDGHQPLAVDGSYFLTTLNSSGELLHVALVGCLTHTLFQGDLDRFGSVCSGRHSTYLLAFALVSIASSLGGLLGMSLLWS